MNIEQGQRIEINNYNMKECKKQASRINKIDRHLFCLPGLCSWTAFRIRLAGKRNKKIALLPFTMNRKISKHCKELLWLAKIMETLGKYSIHRYGAKDSHNICQYRSGNSNIHIWLKIKGLEKKKIDKRKEIDKRNAKRILIVIPGELMRQQVRDGHPFKSIAKVLKKHVPRITKGQAEGKE